MFAPVFKNDLHALIFNEGGSVWFSVNKMICVRSLSVISVGSNMSAVTCYEKTQLPSNRLYLLEMTPGRPTHAASLYALSQV